MNKHNLRKDLIHKRLLLTDTQCEICAYRAKDSFIPIFQKYNPKIVASYCAIKNELNPNICEEYLRKQGVKILYPRMNNDTKQPLSRLTFHETEHFETGDYGILQPVHNSPVYVPDMIICPFVGVDKHKNRLGYGGGFYDMTLANMHTQQIFPVLVGIGYDFQSISDNFAQPHDIQFDEVILINP